MTDESSLSVTMEGLVSGVLLLVSMSMLVFYYVKWRDNNCGWEIMFVMAVECINYIMALSLPFDILYPEMADGNRFCWFRYVMWAMTCPILIQQIIRVLTENEPDLNTVSKLMVANILMDLMGATAAIYSNMYVKVVALTAAFLVFFSLMYSLAFIWLQNRKKFTDKTGRSRRDALIAMLSTWTIFPVLFMLGPACFKVLSYTQSSALHGVGDLLSKNLVGFTSWRIRHSYRVKRMKEEKKNKRKSLQNLKISRLQDQLDEQSRGSARHQHQHGLQAGGSALNLRTGGLQQRDINIDVSSNYSTDTSPATSIPPMSQQEQLQQQLSQMQMQMQLMQRQLQNGSASPGPGNGSPRNGSPRSRPRPLNTVQFVEDLGLGPAMHRLEAHGSQYDASGSPLLNQQKYSSFSPSASVGPESFLPQPDQTRSLPPAMSSRGFSGNYRIQRSGSGNNSPQNGQQFTSIMT